MRLHHKELPMHLMIDLETGGTAPGCAIFSIGACAFDPYSQKTPEITFYQEISHRSNTDIGMRFERETMDWWDRQDNTAPNGNKHIKQCLEDFTLWVSNIPGKSNRLISCVWANSPSFDITILKHVMSLYNMRWPFPYYYERDVRTLKALAFPDGYALNNSHNALDDCHNQITLVQQAYLTLGLTTHETRNDKHPFRDSRTVGVS
jgi:exodeoxyribonuclease VIII